MHCANSPGLTMLFKCIFSVENHTAQGLCQQNEKRTKLGNPRLVNSNTMHPGSWPRGRDIRIGGGKFLVLSKNYTSSSVLRCRPKSPLSGVPVQQGQPGRGERLHQEPCGHQDTAGPEDSHHLVCRQLGRNPRTLYGIQHGHGRKTVS